MNRRRLYIAIAVILLISSAVVAGFLLKAPGSASATPAPKVGHPAPAFTLQNLRGRQISLKQLRGRIVVMNFFATWCIPCRGEMPLLSKLLTRNPRVAVLAIDKQEPASDVTSFVDRYHLAFVPLLDPDLTVFDAYHVSVQPVTFWIDSKGFVRAIHYGPMDGSFMKSEVSRLSRST